MIDGCLLEVNIAFLNFFDVPFESYHDNDVASG